MIINWPTSLFFGTGHKALLHPKEGNKIWFPKARSPHTIYSIAISPLLIDKSSYPYIMSVLPYQIRKKCGYGLVVEHDLAKVETGVRFSLPAQIQKNTHVGCFSVFVRVKTHLCASVGESKPFPHICEPFLW